MRATTDIPEGWAEAISGSVSYGAALGLLAPAVGDRPDLLEPERGGHVAGHGVGVDEQDPLAVVELEGGREARRDGRLADAALRIEDRDDRRALLPIAHLGGRLDDRAGAVVDRDRADAHRLDAPAERLRGVRPGEELVLDHRPRRADGQAVEGSRREDHERRDLAAAIAQQGVVLERGIEVALAVEDRDGDVAATGQGGLEVLGASDGQCVESGLAEFGHDGDLLLGRKCDDDGRTGHRWLLTGCRAQPALRLVVGLGVVGADVQRAFAVPGDAGLEARHAGDRVAQHDVGGVVDGEEELAVGTGRDANRLNAGEPSEMTLEAGDAGDAHEPDNDDLGRLRL